MSKLLISLVSSVALTLVMHNITKHSYAANLDLSSSGFIQECRDVFEYDEMVIDAAYEIMNSSQERYGTAYTPKKRRDSIKGFIRLTRDLSGDPDCPYPTNFQTQD